ncbi:hypothetical protein VNO78_00734 [Psophocarpus tetragonolobus]|uniref:Uncharacterized protein n=1 Tax=Psophocarpus tetragonolobus TaxID=3891 RepID=A0AAN9T0V8_PSOTE
MNILSSAEKGIPIPVSSTHTLKVIYSEESPAAAVSLEESRQYSSISTGCPIQLQQSVSLHVQPINCKCFSEMLAR